MRKIALAAIFALVFVLGASAQLKSAGPYTAEEAVNFANSIGWPDRITAQFLCESYTAGSPNMASYRIVYFVSGLKWLDRDARWKMKEWKMKEGFLTSESALDFGNENRAFPQPAPCWSPTQNPTRATVTLFYVPEFFSEKDFVSYKLLPQSFPTAAKATEYVNRNLTPQETITVIFIPEFFAATQTSNSWRVAFTRDDESSIPLRWKAVTSDSNGQILDLDSALQMVNFADAIGRFSTAWDMWGLKSRIVLFLAYEERPEPEAKLEIPTTVYASRRLLLEKGADYFLRVTDTSAASLYKQTGARIRYPRVVHPLPEWFENQSIVNPVVLAEQIPREPNTLVIAFTHQYLKEPGSESMPHGRLDYAVTRRGWIVVGIYEGGLGERFTPKSSLLHELGHIFGADESDKAESVMCSSAPYVKCSKDSLAFDQWSWGMIQLGIKEIKKNGFDRYQNLRMPGEVGPRSNPTPKQEPVSPFEKDEQADATQKITILFQAVIPYPNCEGVHYELLGENNPLRRAANEFAARLHLPQVNIQVRRGLTETCYNSVYHSRPLNDPKEEFTWRKSIEFIRSPFLSFVFDEQIQIFIDERLVNFLDQAALEYGVLHEVAHQLPVIKDGRFQSWREKELAVDKIVLQHYPRYSVETLIANLDKFIAFKRTVEWDTDKLSSELRATIPDAASALEEQKRYYEDQLKKNEPAQK